MVWISFIEPTGAAVAVRWNELPSAASVRPCKNPRRFMISPVQPSDRACRGKFHGADGYGLVVPMYQSLHQIKRHARDAG
jgi:hypothetical protein